jgi:UDP-N-acetylglucosamine--dolichyl-phosphate N-acetylglucosaminephosphotransferase
MKQMKKIGIVGKDSHKLDHPMIPEMGGFAIIIGVVCSILAGILLFPEKISVFTSFVSTIISAGVIGAIDDIKPLNAKVKPFLTTLACIPILLMQTFTPGIVFPFIGGTRLTRIYPFLIPIVTAVTSNAVNMMDPFNGVMAGTCSIITFTLLISAIILGNSDAIFLTASLLGALLAFYHYNKFPSRVFSGDIGSLSVGVAIGAISIIGRLEVIAIAAFMPQIMNAFYGLSSIGRLYERREVSRPIKMLEDGRLVARDDPNAPITLARFILARGPLLEKEAANVFLILSIISSILALITTYLVVLAI